MSLGERIAKIIAPEAVTLTAEHISRLRMNYDDLKRRALFLERENKRLLKEIMRLKGKRR